MEAETSRAGKSKAAGSLTLGEGEEKFAAASSTESRDGQGWAAGDPRRKPHWHGEAGDVGQGGEFIAPITQAGIFKAALGT